MLLQVIKSNTITLGDDRSDTDTLPTSPIILTGVKYCRFFSPRI